MKDLLPIGSVVILKEGTKQLMVIGFMHYKEEMKEKIYDYLGVPYPEGYIGNNNAFLFNHDSIAEVIFTGYKSIEWNKFLTVANVIHFVAQNEPIS